MDQDATAAQNSLGTFVGSLDDKGLFLRPVRASDRALLVEGFAALGPDSRYQRFFTPKAALSNDELRALTESDGDHHYVLGLAARDSAGHESPVGIARYVRLAAREEIAEAAVTIVDAMQGKGIGKLLWRELAAIAYEHGVRRFRCHVLSDNPAIHKLLHQVDPNPRLLMRDPGSEEYELVLPEPRSRWAEPVSRSEHVASDPHTASGTVPA